MKTTTGVLLIICLVFSACKKDTTGNNAAFIGTYYGTVTGYFYNCTVTGGSTLADTFIITAGSGSGDIIINSQSFPHSTMTGTITQQNAININTQNTYLDGHAAASIGWPADSLTHIENDDVSINGVTQFFGVSLGFNGCYNSNYSFIGTKQ